jgi:hypothetical protein
MLLVGLLSALLSVIELDNWSKAMILFVGFMGGFFAAYLLGVYIDERDN